MTSSTEASLSQSLSKLLDGSDLAAKVGPAFELITVSEEGWPHVALLSVGEVLARSPSELRLAVWASSGTAANLTRDGRGLLALVHEAAYIKVRLEVEPVRGAESGGRALTTFDARVVDVVEDQVPYARLTSGVAFELGEPDAVVDRWAGVVEDMRS